MTNENTIIAARLHDVGQEIGRLREQIATLEKEKAELEVAARVVARLTGNTAAATGTSHGVATAKAVGEAVVHNRSIPELIEEVLREKLAEGIDGVEPKDVASIIRERWRPDVSGTYVSTTFWRMWKNGKLSKDEGSSVYRLPQNVETADAAPTKDAPTASDHQPRAEGREAVPGNGAP